MEIIKPLELLQGRFLYLSCIDKVLSERKLISNHQKLKDGAGEF